MSTSAPTPWIPCSCFGTWRLNAFAAHIGRIVSLRTGGPVTAVVPVHLYGQMADMDPILDLARLYNLIVVEDACQAHGAEYFSKKANRWCKAGSMGQAAAFSFYPGKNLGACGEAGAVTTDDEQNRATLPDASRSWPVEESISTTSRATTDGSMLSRPAS